MEIHTEELDELCFPICAECYGKDVESKHDVDWDVETQTWSIVKDSNYFYCFGTKGGDSYCGEVDLYWIPVNDLVGPPERHTYDVNINYSVRAFSKKDAEEFVMKRERKERLQACKAVVQIEKKCRSEV